MACESCKILIKDILDEMGISPVKFEPGNIDTKDDKTDDEHGNQIL